MDEKIKFLLKETLDIMKILGNDLSKCMYIMQSAPEDVTWWRLQIRIWFSILDTYCFILKRPLLEINSKRNIFLGPKDMEYLKEQRLDTKTGKPRLIKMPFIENINHIFKISNKILGTNYLLSKDSKWTDLKDAVDIRNRITHPKIRADLTISQKDF